MAINSCSHTDRSVGGRICTHLLQVKDANYIKRFTSHGRSYDLVCCKCLLSPDTIDASLINVCNECFREIEDDGSWEGILGSPEISFRPSALRFEHEDITFPELGGVTLLATCPIPRSDDIWLACSQNGTLIEIAPTQRRTRIVAQIATDALDFDGPIIQKPKRDWPKGAAVILKSSGANEFAAIANRYGDKGIVIDLGSGEPTMTLRRDTYHQDVSCFPVDFVEFDFRVFVIHGTAWNRLDVSDARTGALHTERGPTSYRRGDARPPHYLDYFHGSLSVSPGQRCIVDNGWVWAPVGVVVAWDIRRWIDQNVWESEDGESRKSLCWRSYFWDGPHCWLDDQHVAVWGYGQDDEWLIPAVCIFDVTTGKQVRWFPGPKGTLAYDGILFSFDDSEGTSVWDVVTGERLLHDPTLLPLGYHPRSKTFLSIREDGRARISRLKAG